MCGIWGTIGRPAPAELTALIQQNARRGPHAHGHLIHTEEAPGIPIWHRRLGRPDGCDCVQAVAGGLTITAGIGHSRLATTGPHSQDDVEDIQPLRHAGLTIAHNGTIPHPERLIERHHLKLTTGNDSEILLQLADRARAAGAPLEVALAIACGTAIPPAHPFAVILLTDRGEIAYARRTLPLHRRTAGDGLRLSSRPLPDYQPVPPEEHHR